MTRWPRRAKPLPLDLPAPLVSFVEADWQEWLLDGPDPADEPYVDREGFYRAHADRPPAWHAAYRRLDAHRRWTETRRVWLEAHGLAALNLDSLAIAVFSQLASTYRTSPDEPDAMLLFRPADEAEARRLERDVHEARKARRGAVTRAELEEVARIYREHVDASPTHAVQILRGYSERTAARRVQQARAAGLLPPTTPGKRRA